MFLSSFQGRFFPQNFISNRTQCLNKLTTLFYSTRSKFNESNALDARRKVRIQANKNTTETARQSCVFSPISIFIFRRSQIRSIPSIMSIVCILFPTEMVNSASVLYKCLCLYSRRYFKHFHWEFCRQIYWVLLIFHQTQRIEFFIMVTILHMILCNSNS